MRENLETGFAVLPRRERVVADEIFALSPVLGEMRWRRGGDLSGDQQQVAIARALLTEPKLLILDEPTEGIQPSTIKDSAAVIRGRSARGTMTILLAGQFLDFAWDLADRVCMLDRSQVARGGPRGVRDAVEVRRRVAV